MNEQKMERCLFAKWAGKRPDEAAQKEIQSLLCRRSPSRLLRDLRGRVDRGGDAKIPNDTFITVCALFCRGRDSFKEIADVVSEYEMGRMLFAGYSIFISGGRCGTKVLIQYSDEETPNRYEWLSYWEGMGRYPAYRELFMVSRLLKGLDEDKFWQIAKEDPNDFILMNWSKIFWKQMPPERARELMVETESVRRQALGFWCLAPTFRYNPEMEEQAGALLSTLTEVPETVLVPRLYEFLVAELECPRAFRAYLLKPSRDGLLRQEVEREGMLPTPREAVRVAALIREIPSKRRQGFYWKILRSWLEATLGSGKLNCDTRGLELGAELLAMFPEAYQRQLTERLRTKCTTLHTEMLDYIIRPTIHQREALQKAAIERLLSSV